ncbi:MAG: InlB B-repeat-containing protein [Defluviitaleaceae bacterium]|nr:InlB B-repeat-containing protein [Defluviitaleaceae bacterium]
MIRIRKIKFDLRHLAFFIAIAIFIPTAANASDDMVMPDIYPIEESYEQGNGYNHLPPDIEATQAIENNPINVNIERFEEDMSMFPLVAFEPNGGITEEGHRYVHATIPAGAYWQVGSTNMPIIPTREGFAFRRWNTQPDDDGDVFTGTSPVPGDMPVFAQWGVELIFNGNGAALIGDDPSNPNHYATRIIPEGANVSSTPDIVWPNDPQREGFIFRGWYTEANPVHQSPLPPPLGQPFDESTPVNLRITIFARWEVVPAHLVTFDLQGGSLLSSDHSAYRLARQGMSINASVFPPHHLNVYPNLPPGHVGTTLLWPQSAPGVTRPNMTIEGWWTAPGGSGGGGTRFAPAGGNHVAGAISVAFPAGFANTPVLSDMTVYANWVFRVEFVPNDGTNFLNAQRWRDIPSGTYPNGTVAGNGMILAGGGGTPGMPTFTGSQPGTPHIPVREGYTFAGWYTHADRSQGSSWDANTPVTQSMRVYAQWEPNALMSVTFNLDGGQWPDGGNDPEVIHLPHQATIASATGITMPPIPQPPATGFIFGGWYSAPGGAGPVFDRLTPVTENRQVYARWMPAGEVRLHSNGGAFSAVAIAGGNVPPLGTPQTIIRTLPIGSTFGAHHTFWQRNEGPANRYSLAIFTSPHFTNPNRNGFTFMGWNTMPDGRGEMFDRTTVIDGGRDIYAVWSNNVTFDNNHSTLSPGMTNTSINYMIATGWTVNTNHLHASMPNDQLVVPFPTMQNIDLIFPGLRHPYLAFRGWNTQRNGQGQWFVGNEIINGNITVYAIWDQSVAFNSGAAPREAILPENAVRIPSSLGYPLGNFMPPDPEPWDGHIFRGWNTRPDGTGSTFGPNVVVYGVLEVYAIWGAIVTFNPSGGTMTPPDPYQATAEINRPMGAAYPTNQPTRNSWYFTGWWGNIGTDHNQFVTRFSQDGPVVPRSMTLIAQWEANVTFNLNGGNIAGSTVNPTRTLPENSTVAASLSSMPANPQHPDPDYYTFSHWEDAAGNTFDANTPMTTGNITVYARWARNSSNFYDHDLTINNNPLTVVPVEQSTGGTFAVGTQVSLAAGTAAGFTFDGWTSTQPITFADAGSANTTFDMIDGPVTVTAHWMEHVNNNNNPTTPPSTHPNPGSPGNTGGGATTGPPGRPAGSNPAALGRPGNIPSHTNENAAGQSHGFFTAIDGRPGGINTAFVDDILPYKADQPQYNDIIRIPINHHTIYRGDGVTWTETTMDTTAFIAADGSVMIPIRFLTYSLRYPVLWDPNLRTATLNPGDNQILITAGSAVMGRAGQTSIPITNRFGASVPAYLRPEHDRILLPMRALGMAFNIEYEWDEEAQEALFYPLRPLLR